LPEDAFVRRAAQHAVEHLHEFGDFIRRAAASSLLSGIPFPFHFQNRQRSLRYKLSTWCLSCVLRRPRCLPLPKQEGVFTKGVWEEVVFSLEEGAHNI
jgi:hypothetical protein